MVSNIQISELKSKIEKHLSASNGEKDYREIAICWEGYLAALLDVDLISISDHENLSDLLPKIDNNPVVQIFTGV